jgi:phage tail-like protein
MPPDPEFAPAVTRQDPYRNFKFRIKWGGRYVAGVSKVSALTRTTPVVAHRAGGDPSTPRRAPGQSEYQAITLERGVTHDVAFEQWANKVWDYHTSTADGRQGVAGHQEVSFEDFRKDLILEVFNEAGQKVMAYNIYRCWPSEFTAVPEMDAGGNVIAIQSLTVENEGWERDWPFEEPADASSLLPDSEL